MIISRRHFYLSMKLDAIVKTLRPLETLCLHDNNITGLTYDSRMVEPGYAFIAVRGEHSDGHEFVADAIMKGATAIVCEDDVMVPRHVATIKVADSRVALAQLACAFHGSPSSYLKMVGVTGTNGKTTVSHLVRHFFQYFEPEPGLIGTVGYRIGERNIPATRTTPEAPELQAMLESMVEAELQHAIMEVSSHALVQERVYGIDFDIGIFTNLTQDHLDYHGSLDHYFEAKAKLFTTLGTGDKEGTVAILNSDDEHGRILADKALPSAILNFGTRRLPDGSAPDVFAERIELSRTGSAFHITTPWGAGEVQLPLLGRFNVSNALAALTAAGSAGVPFAELVERLRTIPEVPGRLERIPSERGLVFVDYAHTDDALRSVLQTLRDVAADKKITVVFGCGGNRDTTKRAPMGQVAARLADYAIITNDNPRREDPAIIAAEVARGFKGSEHFEIVLDREQAIATAVDQLGDDEILLIAGKGHETYQEFSDTIVPFDDRRVARDLLERRESSR